MITKTAVHYASNYLYKEAALPSLGGIKAGLGKVKNFLGNINPVGGYNPNTIGAVSKAPLTTTYARPLQNNAPSALSNRISNMSNFTNEQLALAKGKGINLGQTRLNNNMLADLKNNRSAVSKSIARHAKKVRAQNSVPKKVNTPTPQQTTTPAPQQTTTPTPQQTTTPTPQQTTTPTPEVNPTPQPQYTQEQMDAAKNTNLLGGAVIGAGALGGLNYVGTRLFAQPRQPMMMPMMMPMPMY